jgi:hypothetical protein
MRFLVGTVVLAGAGLQGVAHFVPSHGASLWDYNHDDARTFVYYAAYMLAVVALAAAGIEILAVASRTFAAFGAGVAAMAAILWSHIAFAEWFGGYGSTNAQWNGVLGLVGAIVAGIGSVIGWTVGFDARLGATASPGWYADPSGPGQRWWDGTAWTAHTAP